LLKAGIDQSEWPSHIVITCVLFGLPLCSL